MLYFTSELELRSNINMSRYNSELFPGCGGPIGRDPAPVVLWGRGLLPWQLPEAPIFQYWGSSVNLKLIVNGGARPKNPSCGN